MNKDLLFQLYAIHSPSGGEKKMRRFLRKQAMACGATSVETDKYGNLLIVKGQADTYPCLAAHMDQVQRTHSKDFRAVEIDGDVIGWSVRSHEQQGLGADDKNGIFICLELLKRFDVMKVAFFVGEEVGCTGSSDVDLQFFKDCRFIIEPDRRGSSDLITSMYCGDVCSEKFIGAIGAKQYGYKEDVGSITDVGELVERGVGVSCLNLSCGYYNAHTDHEYTVLSELENCMEFVAHIVETCTDTYPFEGGYGGLYGKYGRYGLGRYGRYDDWYGYGYYGGKRYDGASKALSPAATTVSTTPTSDELMTEEDYAYYYDGGYYDSDYALMEEYLDIQPDLTFDQIAWDCLPDFAAFSFFDKDECESILRDIYHALKEQQYSHEAFWGEDDDDDVVFDLKKAS